MVLPVDVISGPFAETVVVRLRPYPPLLSSNRLSLP